MRRAQPVVWAGGTATLLLALVALAGGAHRSMHDHMVQHLLLVDLAAPLLAAGGPWLLRVRALRPGVAGLLRSRALRAALHPAAAVVAFAAVVGGSHWPAIYDAALDHPALHALEHLAYLGSAMLFWGAVLAPRPLPRRSPLVRVLILLLAMPPMALAGVGIMATSRPAYRHYGLADQHGAGRLMWVGGTLPMGAVVLALAVAGANEEERRQRRRELYEAAA